MAVKKMGRLGLIAALTATLLGSPVSVSATGDSVSAKKTLEAVVVDGNLNDSVWTIDQALTKTVIGTNNNTATYGVLWDDTYLYVGVKVLDGTLKNDSTNVYDDDSVEVYIDGNHNHSSTYESTPDRLYTKGYNDSAIKERNSKTSGVLHGWAAITGGYSVELAIPWSNISKTPTAGMTIGFDVGNNDDDNGSARDNQTLWSGVMNNTPASFGDLTLSATTVGSSTPPPGGGGLPVIPGAVGFGIDTRAAYAGSTNPTVYKVTNLNASGSGSLKAAIDASGPRVVVFEVSGTIEIEGSLNVANPYLTIAGQTAPSPGITVKQATMNVKTHDVLVQHLRFRVGDESGSPDYGIRDGLSIGDDTPGEVYNVVFDHCSFSWGIDENASVWSYGENISYLNSIISEALYDSVHPDGPHSKGSLLNQKSKKVSMIGNIFAHNHERNPLSRTQELVFVNNIIYNWGNKAVELQNQDGLTSKNTIQGNVFIGGADSTAKPVFIRGNNATTEMKPGSQVYVHDNDSSYYVSDDWDIVSNQYNINVKVTTPPTWVPDLVALPVANDEAYDWVMARAGARPADRDSVDARIIDDIINGTGSLIDSQTEVGGFPALAMNTRTLTVPANPHNDDDSDGYTNLEEWLHSYSEDVE